MCFMWGYTFYLLVICQQLTVGCDQECSLRATGCGYSRLQRFVGKIGRLDPCYAMLCAGAMLCNATMLYAMLCYAMLCYAMLCYAMLCYAMLCYMLCYFVLCATRVRV
jgi:hypothetical protein